MSRKQDQLEILHNKLSQRYGAGDVLCKQVAAALESRRKFGSTRVNKPDWSVSYAHTIEAHRIETFQNCRH